MKPVCLVTGAGGALGSVLCEAFANEYSIVAAYRRVEPAVSSQIRLSMEDGPSVFCVQADLNRREDIRRLVEVAMAKYGRIDSIVHAAADAKNHGKLLELWHDEDYAPSQLQTNCIAPIQLVSAVHYHCWKDDPDQNRAHNRSVVSLACTTGAGFRAASHAALTALTVNLSDELAPYAVRANALCFSAAARKRVAAAVRELLVGTETGVVKTLG